MDLLDAVLLVICLLFALSGFRQGFLIGVLSLVGFLGGGVIGAKIAPALHRDLHVSFNAAVFGLVVVFLVASIGQLVATAVGVALRRQLSWSPARTVDSLGGAVVSVVSVLLVAWFVGSAVAHTSLTGLARQVQRSAVLGAVNDIMPSSATTWFSAFRRLLDENGFPQVFGSLGPETIVPVAPPDPAVLNSRAVTVAKPDIVKITGAANACGRELEGSGFLFAAEHVMTNAHVVAGVRNPTVTTVSGTRYAARVVLYDPERDVAVLYVPGFDRAPLSFAGGTAARGASGVVAGYPEDNPFTAVAARIRGEENVRGPDIYQEHEVTRAIYSLYAIVRPGNSGGPLLSTSGQVDGVVFAQSVTDSSTGYALTAAEVAPDATAGAGRTAAVSTQGCD